MPTRADTGGVDVGCRPGAARHASRTAGSPERATTQVLPRVVEGTVPPGTSDRAGGRRPSSRRAVRGRRRRRSSSHSRCCTGCARPGAFGPARPAGTTPPAVRTADGDAPVRRRRPVRRRPYRDRAMRRRPARRGTTAAGTAADAARPCGTRTTPGRRMNLGVVLLPLRIFLGFISIYAGMGKLCDPVYFDGGDRGSMVTWLRSLDPWAVAVAAARLRAGAPGRLRADRRLPPDHRRRADGLRPLAARRRRRSARCCRPRC